MRFAVRLKENQANKMKNPPHFCDEPIWIFWISPPPPVFLNSPSYETPKNAINKIKETNENEITNTNEVSK
jgi:hypothetical protein